MSGRRSIRPSIVLGLALGGVLAGHTLAYRLLVPDGHARAAELAATGHGYLARANTLGLAAAIVALAALFLGRLLGAETAPTSSIAARLVGFQLAAFASMEVLERLTAGAGLRHLPAVLLVGLPVQAIVAASIAVLARFLLRTADLLAALGRDPSPPSRLALASLPMPAAPQASAASWGAPPGRGPPGTSVPV
jgi:hypothetical protein